MSSDDAESEDEKPSYGFWGRAILFLVITGPGTVIALGLWIRIGAGASLTAAMSKGNWSLLTIFALWVLGTAGSAFAIFKR